MIAVSGVKLRRIVLMAVLLGSCLWILQGRSADYSFNSDELFSLAASRAETWQSLFIHWILPDTFPPLYPVLLKAWIALFGTSEVAVRSLSVIFSVLSLVAVVPLTTGRSLRARLLTLGFLGCSPALIIYSQYARAYALMIFLSVLTTGAALQLRRSAGAAPTRGRQGLVYLFYGSALLLSLSHYFGWLFASLLLLRNLIDRGLDRNRLRSLGLFLVITVWPVVHVLSGSFADKTGRIGWITPNPISGVMNAFLEAAFPLAPEVSFPWSPSGSYPWPLVVYGLIAAVALYATGSFRRLIRILWPDASLAPADPVSECHYLISTLALFLLIVLVVDLRTPFGVGRYFTVLLPPVAFLFGAIPDLAFPRQTSLQKLMTSALLVVVMMAQLAKSHQDVLAMAMPVVDYKSLTQFMRSTNLCDEGCHRQDTRYFFHDALAASPYFDGMVLRKAKLDASFSMSGRLPFVGYHRDGLALQLQAANPDAQCWEPRQRKRASAFVFMAQDSRISPGESGLIPCRIQD